MRLLRAFARDQRATSAAEFAMIMPALLLTLFGIIDAGRFAWNFNRSEKATQIGARWAAATDMVPSGTDGTGGLANYKFALQASPPISQGQPVPTSAFPGVSCSSTAGTVSCTCATGGTCSFPLTANTNAFNRIVDRMQKAKKDISYSQVVIDYQNSGLGFSGDPNGPDVAPIITVRLRNVQFKPLTLFIFNTSFNMPSASYSMTMEDGQGTTADY